MARSLYAAGQLEEAGALFEDLVGDAPRNIDAVAFRGYLGAIAAQKGDRERALEISRRLGELEQPEALGENTYWQACIAALLGDKERAVGLLRQAFRNGYSYFTLTPDLHSDFNLTSLHGYPPFQELLRPKG